MFDQEDVLRAARSLRPYLSEIMPSSRASSLGDDIDHFLERAKDGEKIDNMLLERMAQEDELRAWLKEALLEEEPRGVIKASRNSALAGDVDSVPALHFVCPIEGCDFTWHLRRVGQPVPPCVVHKVALVLAGQER